MPAPSLTYTLTNGTTADATKVMENFNNLLNGITDGTKDLSINALTCAGNVTVNGNTTLGNASSDTLTVTASLASDIVPSTDGTRSLGSATYGFAGLFLGDTAGETVKIASGNNTADWTLTLPTGVPTGGQLLKATTAGVASWGHPGAVKAVGTGDYTTNVYTITDDDGYDTYLCTTSTTARTITLPTAADNSGRRITVIKADNGSGSLTLDGEGSETINGSTTQTVLSQYGRMSVVSDGTGWYYYEARTDAGTFTPVLKEGSNTLTTSSATGTYTLIGDICNIQIAMPNITKSGTGDLTVTGLPFTSSSISNYVAVIHSGPTQRFTPPASCIYMYGSIGASTTTLGLSWFKSGDFNGLGVTASDIASAGSSDLYLSGAYKIA